MKIGLAFAVISALSAFVASAQDEPSDPGSSTTEIEVMVLGSYHFANPRQDVVNVEVDDMLAPRRQREIQVLVDVLADWRPSKVAVEGRAAPPSFELEDFAEAGELLATSRDESVQIGYRLARQLGHEAVYGFDEKPEGDEPDYFPFGEVQSFAQENGGAEILDRVFAEVQAEVSANEAKLPHQSVAESLVVHNDEDVVGEQHNRAYYSMLAIGNGDQQPGAELNAYWYMRNAKMFAKLDMIAEPGDRVLVIVGSGHATWLKHFVRRMPGYTLVDALPYVREAADTSVPEQ